MNSTGLVQPPLSSEERARRRVRRAGVSAAASIAGRVLALGSVLASTPIALQHLGPEQFGLWVTIGSIGLLLSYGDFGIGDALANALSEADAREDFEVAQAKVSSSFLALAIVAVTLSVFLLLVSRYIPWGLLYNVRGAQASELAEPATLVFFLLTIATLPFAVSYRIHLGYQQAYIATFWQAAGSLFTLLGVALCAARGGSLVWMSGALGGGPFLASLLCSAHQYIRHRPELRPSVRTASLILAKQLFHDGTKFFAVSSTGALRIQLPNLVVAQILGARFVATFAVPMRLYLLIPNMIGLALLPLWPAYTESLSRGDGHWARLMLKRSMISSVILAALAAGGISIYHRDLLLIWVGESIKPPLGLIIVFAVWSIVATASGSVGMFLNNPKGIGFQARSAVAAAALNVPLAFYFTRTIGLAGALLAWVTVQVIFVLGPARLVIPRILNTPPKPSIPRL